MEQHSEIKKPLSLPKILLGQLSRFENSFQAVADKLMENISWKQFFLITRMEQYNRDLTVNELAEMAGSSHQNVKQLLLKLEKKGFVTLCADETDKRKLRIHITEACRTFSKENNEKNTAAMEQLFAGISEEQLKTTIQTLTVMEQNLSGLRGEQ